MKLFGKLFSKNKDKFNEVSQRNSHDISINEKYYFLMAEHKLCEYIIKVFKKNKIKLQGDHIFSKGHLPEYSYSFDELLSIAINANEYDKAILAKIESHYPEIKNYFKSKEDKIWRNPF